MKLFPTRRRRLSEAYLRAVLHKGRHVGGLSQAGRAEPWAALAAFVSRRKHRSTFDTRTFRVSWARGVVRRDTRRAAPIPVGGSGRKRAGFRVTAITGLSVNVEIAMVASQGNGERPFLAVSGKICCEKIELHNKAGLNPVIIWADEAASPRILAKRFNDICARLGLPIRPPAPLAWYEESTDGKPSLLLPPAIEARMADTPWLLSKCHRRIAQVRSDTIVMNQRIPAYFEQLPLSELADIVTAAWFMAGHVSIDSRCLVELDVLGAALKLPGGQTRRALQVRDAIRGMGLSNYAWKKLVEQPWTIMSIGLRGWAQEF